MKAHIRRLILALGAMVLGASTAAADNADHARDRVIDRADVAETAPTDQLEAALARSMPKLATTSDHVHAARAAADTIEVRGAWYEITPEMLLAMAWVESRYVPTAVSRLECDAAGVCTRRTGNWRHRFPARFSQPYFCGFLQAHVRTERECRAIGADIQAAYTGAVAHLVDWIRFCAVDRQARRHRDRIGCALAGYNGGVRSARTLRPKYPRAVRKRADRLASGWPN
jgi:soluble lytic murein transglycosylase-like protein